MTTDRLPLEKGRGLPPPTVASVLAVSTLINPFATCFTSSMYIPTLAIAAVLFTPTDSTAP